MFILFFLSRVWSIDTDDFLGDCDIENDTFSDFKPIAGVKLNIPKRYNANYPLLRTINEATVLALDEIAQEAQLPNRDKDNEINHGTDSDGKGAACDIKSNMHCIFFGILLILRSTKSGHIFFFKI